MNYLTKFIQVILVILLLVAALAKVILISTSSIVLLISSQQSLSTVTSTVEFDSTILEQVENEKVEIEEEVLETVLEINGESEEEWYEQFEIDEDEIESYNIFPELGLAFVWNNEQDEAEVFTTEYFHNYNQVGVIFDNTFCPVILDPDDGYYVKLPCHNDGEGIGLLPLECILKTMMQMNYEASSTSTSI